MGSVSRGRRPGPRGRATRTAPMTGRPMERAAPPRETPHRSLTRYRRAPPPHNDTCAPSATTQQRPSPPPRRCLKRARSAAGPTSSGPAARRGTSLRCRNRRMPPLESPQRAGDTRGLEAPVERKRMLVIANPYATTVSERLKSLVVYALQGRYDVRAVDTEGRDHATELCRDAAAEGYDVVVAFGGDGTVNEAANGLAGSATALTPLPGGATNVYCRMLGIPVDIVDATEHLLRVADEWRPRRLDLGSVNGRHFVFSSGYGLDAAVVRRVDAHPKTKARFRHWYYAAAGLATFAREYVVHPPRLDLEVGGETVRGVTALVQTGDPYTYFSRHPLHVADRIALDDGTIAGAMLRRSRPYDVPTVLARLFSERRRVGQHRRVFAWNGRRDVRATSADGRPVPLQVDGDYIGDTVEARFEVLPGALTVLS